MATALNLGKPLVFACGKVEVVAEEGYGSGSGSGRAGGEGGGGSGAAEVKVMRGGKAFSMLDNCSKLVDIEAAEAAVPADKIRELATIGEAQFGHFNRTVAGALAAGATAVRSSVFEVDAFNCGEPGPLRALPTEEVWRAFKVACSAGQLAVLVELRRTHGEAVAAYLAGKGGDAIGEGRWFPLWIASYTGRQAVVEWLLEEVGTSAKARHMTHGASALFVAAQGGHLAVLRALADAGADISAPMTGIHWSPLFVAALVGHASVVAELVERGADPSTPTAQDHTGVPRGSTALSIAQCRGHAEVTAILGVAVGA